MAYELEGINPVLHRVLLGAFHLSLMGDRFPGAVCPTLLVADVSHVASAYVREVGKQTTQKGFIANKRKSATRGRSLC